MPIEKRKRVRVTDLRLGDGPVTSVAADLNLLAGGAGAGITVADLRLLAGGSAAGITTADLALVKGVAAAAKLAKVAKVALGVGTTAGACFAWANPEPGAIIVERVVLDVTTVAAGAGTVSVGQAANGTTSSANLIDTLDVHSATGQFDNLGSPGAGGKAVQKVAAGAFVTGSKASGALTGLVGSAYIHYFSA